jgi:molybdopterin-binding protein
MIFAYCRLKRLFRQDERAVPSHLIYLSYHMALSARNQLPGTVEEVRLGDVMAHVVVKVGWPESLISRASADELKLHKGDAVQVVVKSTEVMIRKD